MPEHRQEGPRRGRPEVKTAPKRTAGSQEKPRVQDEPKRTSRTKESPRGKPAAKKEEKPTPKAPSEATPKWYQRLGFGKKKPAAAAPVKKKKS